MFDKNNDMTLFGYAVCIIIAAVLAIALSFAVDPKDNYGVNSIKDTIENMRFQQIQQGRINNSAMNYEIFVDIFTGTKYVTVYSSHGSGVEAISMQEISNDKIEVLMENNIDLNKEVLE